MVWELEKRGRRSRLVGTAHFFPYHFRGALRRLIGAARTVLFEGPLDERSMRRVVDAGSGAVHVSLFHALDAPARRRICRDLGLAEPLEPQALYREAFFGRPVDWLEAELRGQKPWRAFFSLWTRYRAREGGNYSLDRDAYGLAAGLGKDLHHLETIDEQIAALEAIPLERIVHFLAHVDWADYYSDYVRRYLDGDLDGLMAAARVFPSFCEAVIERRDPLLAERMTPALEGGDACVFIGITHCPGVLSWLRAEGFELSR
jgi:TraB/PrgY/gumN family